MCVLNANGYNVNQNEGLSATTRRKILSVLLDNSILKKVKL